MYRSHKIVLQPNNVQKTYLKKACGVARFAYNWGLNEWTRMHENGELPTANQVYKRLNTIKKEQFPWMLDVTKGALQQAIFHLGDAFQNFYAHRARVPKFKKKGRDDSFSLSNDLFRVEGKKIRIPKLGWVRMRQELRFNGKLIRATVSYSGGKWFVGITVDVPECTTRRENQAVVGVDLGINRLVTLSDGTLIEGRKPYRNLINRVKMLSRNLSKKKSGSQNYKKARRKLARLHARIANMRADELHKITCFLTDNYSDIVIEDLNVMGMLSNRHLAMSVMDMSFSKFRVQLVYKCQGKNVNLHVADRWFASSKICSCCGFKTNKLPLSTRKWTCTQCGVTHDRDINAAINLSKLVAVSPTI